MKPTYLLCLYPDRSDYVNQKQHCSQINQQRGFPWVSLLAISKPHFYFSFSRLLNKSQCLLHWSTSITYFVSISCHFPYLSFIGFYLETSFTTLYKNTCLLFMTLVYLTKSEHHQENPIPYLSHKASYLYGSLGYPCQRIMENNLKRNKALSRNTESCVHVPQIYMTHTDLKITSLWYTFKNKS
jgi:hypothetical protein